MKHLTQEQRLDIINEYSNNLTPVIQLSKKHGITRQGVYKILKTAGVDTKKGKITVSCSHCGKSIQRHKYIVRRTLNNFCDYKCYYQFLSLNSFIENRHGSRVGRALIHRYYSLLPEQIVHHIDGNQNNNDIKNLMVFANQGDHIRFHRGFDVLALWDGRNQSKT